MQELGYYYNANRNPVVYITINDTKGHTAKSQLFFELKNELVKNNLSSTLLIDTTSEVIMLYPKVADFYYFNEWCCYIGNNALNTIKSKQLSGECFTCSYHFYSYP